MPKLSSIATLPTAFRHRLWAYEESLRSGLGGGRLGFPRRATPTARVALREARAREGWPRRALTRAPRHAGLIGRPGGSAFAHATTHFGIELEAGGEAEIFSRATDEQWPLLAIESRFQIAPVAGAAIRYLRTGGTIFIPQLTVEDDDWLQELAIVIQVAIPRCRALPHPATHVTFSGARPDITADLSGLTIDNSEGSCFLAACAGCEPLAWFVLGTDALSGMVDIATHGGHIVLAAGPPPPPRSLYELFQPEHALSLVPAMMVVRHVYGEAAWHAPFAMANFTVDDPVLRDGFLGLNYSRALAAAREDDFHVTVATVPRELGLAEAATVRLLADNHDRVSACYHGNDHDGYEFFVTDDGRSRWRSRALTGQRAALAQAAARGNAFARRTGHALDRVMVFPHGVGPAAILGELGELGFLATSNWLDRYPLASPAPAQADLGMRPADVAWDGFPLLWRRPLEDETFAFDLFIGRPALHFTHRKQAGGDFEALRELAGRINEVAVEKVRWRGLEEVARHAYVQRRDADGQGWEVLMTANLACLHNSDRDMRHYRVCRPRLGPSMLLSAAGVTSVGGAIEVDVAAGETVTVKVIGPIAELLDPLAGRPCSLDDKVEA